MFHHFRCLVKSIDTPSIQVYLSRMAPPARLSPSVLTDSALGIVDARGFDALTLSAVAEDLEVATSALYTHCRGLDGLRSLVATAATTALTERVRDAAIGTAGDDALDAIGTAYRTFARDFPGRFAATLRPPADDPSFTDANTALVGVFALVYTATGLADDDSHLAARSTRSAIHGFLALEHTIGSTPDHDAEYQHLLRTLQRGLDRPQTDKTR